jgi:hypothetical protein
MRNFMYTNLTLFSLFVFMISSGLISASASPAPELAVPVQSETDTIKGADVLVYEDPDADLRLLMRVNKAIENFDFEGGDVVYAGNNLPLFTRELEENDWDLVIMAVESRWTVDLGDLGLLNPITEHLESGGALIVETWNLDEDDSALGELLLDVCNAHVEKDWHRDNDMDDLNRADFAILPNPSAGINIFTGPYRTFNEPLDPTLFWNGDAGDLIRLDDESDNEILAGLQSDDADNYGLLTSCLNGRMILQTLSTHDYSIYETNLLWQNMIYYTLDHYFAQQGG